MCKTLSNVFAQIKARPVNISSSSALTLVALHRLSEEEEVEDVVSFPMDEIATITPRVKSQELGSVEV